jgi:hypothetical protein
LAISLLVVTLAGPGLALGQGAGAIQVLNHWQEVDFPHHLTIGVIAEGEHDIVEVKVNYRPAGPGIWAYGYSNFNPGRQITAEFDLPVSGPHYLPPGAQIEYYYSIKDVLGNVHDTPAQVVEYSDTRFPWESTKIGPLILFYHDVPQARVDGLSRDLDGEIQRLRNLLDLDNEGPVRGFIYNGFAEAQPAFPYQSQAITREEVFHGFAFPAHRVFVGIGMQARLIVHEVSHLMLAQALDSGSGHIPAWLDEGLATFVEPGSNPYSGQSLGSQGPSLRAMSAVSGTPDEINYFYLKSESVVSFLINEYGTQAFQQFLAELRQGRSPDAALIDTYGFDTDGLEANWVASPAGRTSPYPGRPHPAAPFLFFNNWFLAGLVLVVMALVFIRYVIRKLRPSADDEDRLYP